MIQQSSLHSSEVQTFINLYHKMKCNTGKLFTRHETCA